MRILVVEDERGLRDALIRTLTDEGWNADGAGDGETGLDLIETGVYDLVILDIMLPVMNGLEVLSRIREEGADVLVILLTARSELSDKVDGMDRGADDYLTKPFEMEELLARIRMVTRRNGRVGQDNNLHAGTLTLHTGTHAIFSERTGKTVKLGSKEYFMLEYMMVNQGQILTREQITEKVWGFDADAEYNNVDVYISFLRKKLKFIGEPGRIASVRGVGYILANTEKQVDHEKTEKKNILEH